MHEGVLHFGWCPGDRRADEVDGYEGLLDSIANCPAQFVFRTIDCEVSMNRFVAARLSRRVSDLVKKGVFYMDLSVSNATEVLQKLRDVMHGKSVVFESEERVMMREIMNTIGCGVQSPLCTALKQCIPNRACSVWMHLSSLYGQSGQADFSLTADDGTKTVVYSIKVISVSASRVLARALDEGVYTYKGVMNGMDGVVSFLNGGDDFAGARTHMDDVIRIARDLEIDVFVRRLERQREISAKMDALVEEFEPRIEDMSALYDDLCNLDEVDFDKMVEYLSGPRFFPGHDNVNDLVCCFEWISRRRNGKQKLYAQLVKRIWEVTNSDFFLNALKHRLVFIENNKYRALLYHMYQLGIVSIDDIGKGVVIGVKRRVGGCMLFETLFMWFLPELLTTATGRRSLNLLRSGVGVDDVDLDFDEEDEECGGRNHDNPLESLISYVSMMSEKRYGRRWDTMKMERETGQNSCEAAIAIANDDVEALEKLIFVRCGDIPMCPFDNVHAMSLIEYAVFKGSWKCFDRLEVCARSPSWNSKFLIASAVDGGNLDIFRRVWESLEPHDRVKMIEQGIVAVIARRRDLNMLYVIVDDLVDEYNLAILSRAGFWPGIKYLLSIKHFSGRGLNGAMRLSTESGFPDLFQFLRTCRDLCSSIHFGRQVIRQSATVSLHDFGCSSGDCADVKMIQYVWDSQNSEDQRRCQWIAEAFGRACSNGFLETAQYALKRMGGEVLDVTMCDPICEYAVECDNEELRDILLSKLNDYGHIMRVAWLAVECGRLDFLKWFVGERVSHILNRGCVFVMCLVYHCVTAAEALLSLGPLTVPLSKQCIVGALCRKSLVCIRAFCTSERNANEIAKIMIRSRIRNAEIAEYVCGYLVDTDVIWNLSINHGLCERIVQCLSLKKNEHLVNKSVSGGDVPIVVAAQKGYFDIVDILLDVPIVVLPEQKVFLWAASWNNVVMMKKIVSRWSECRMECIEAAILGISASSEHIEKLSYLIELAPKHIHISVFMRLIKEASLSRDDAMMKFLVQKNIIPKCLSLPVYVPDKEQCSLDAEMNAAQLEGIYFLKAIEACDWKRTRNMLKDRNVRFTRITLVSAAVRNAPDDILLSIVKLFRVGDRAGVLSAIFHVTRYDRLSVFEALLALVGSDINICDEYGRPILWQACCFRAMNIIDFVISHPTFDPSKACGVLSFAGCISSGSCDLFERLLSVDLVTDLNEPVPATVNDAERADIYSKIADGEQKTYTNLPVGVSLLSLAIFRSTTDIVTLLLSSSRVSPPTGDMMTSTEYRSIPLLIQNSADVNAQ